ncbi:MAG: polysaccharide biosynthesis protein, partial [bacterium]
RMIRLAGFEPDVDIKIKYTGLRPGEKLYEELLSTEENTLPTKHQKIHIAKVREYIYADLLDKFGKMDKLAVAVNVDDTVKLMKEIVPEFKSKNSVFEKFDVVFEK